MIFFENETNFKSLTYYRIQIKFQNSFQNSFNLLGYVKFQLLTAFSRISVSAKVKYKGINDTHSLV